MSLLISLLMSLHPVTVKAGDSLWALFGAQWPAVAQANNLKDPNIIYPGQRLTVPDWLYDYESSMEMTPVVVTHQQAQQPTIHQYLAPIHPQVAVSSVGGWTGPWACIAQHESGGNPAENTGNGFYGGLQFAWSTWQTEAPKAGVSVSNPASASIAQQEAVANQLLADAGWGQWPNTSRMCGFR